LASKRDAAEGPHRLLGCRAAVLSWQETALDEALRNNLNWRWAFQDFVLVHVAIYVGSVNTPTPACGQVRPMPPWLRHSRIRIGGEGAAAMFTLIEPAKLNNVDLQAWLADVLRRIADHPLSRLHQLLPWNWASATQAAAA
jgi:hypothetical protein